MDNVELENERSYHYRFISCNRTDFKCIEDCYRPCYNLKQLYYIYKKDKNYKHKRDNRVDKKYILWKYYKIPF